MPVIRLRLTTGRLRDQWHGMSRTGRAARLAAHEPTPRLCCLTTTDIERRGFKPGDLASELKAAVAKLFCRWNPSDELKLESGVHRHALGCALACLTQVLIS
jgi:assimilatory nitrate reductase catalytic subunit